MAEPWTGNQDSRRVVEEDDMGGGGGERRIDRRDLTSFEIAIVLGASALCDLV